MNLQAVIETNNHTVLLVEHQRVHEAIQVSLFALQQFQDYLTERILGLPAEQQQSIFENHNHQILHHAIDMCMRVGDLDEDCQEGTATHAFIYQSGILLPPNIIRADPDIFLSILIFNAALSHQLSAISSTEQRVSQINLRVAKGLYELAFRVQCDCCNPAFRVALVNNLGVIYRIIGGQEHILASERLFSYLESFALYFLTSGRCHEIEKVNGFWANIQPNHRAAPVA